MLFSMLKKPISNQVATNKDIHEFRNKFKKTEKNLRADSLKLEARLENLEEGQKRIEITVNRTANTLDSFLKRLDNLETDNKVGTNQTRDLRVQIDDQEERISRLE